MSTRRPPAYGVRQLARTFGPELWAVRYRILLANSVTLIAVAANALSPWPLKQLIDGLITGVPSTGAATEAFGREPHGFAIGLGLVFLSLSLISAFAESGDGLITAQIRERLSRAIRDRVMAHLQTLPPTIRTKYRSGELVLRLVGDVEHFARLWTKTLPLLGRVVATTIVTIAGIAWLSPWMGAMCLWALPALALLVRHFGRRVAQTSRAKRQREGEVAAMAQEIVRGLPVIQALGASAGVRSRFDRVSAAGLRAGVEAARAAARLERGFEIARAMATALVMVGGALMVLRGWLTVGSLTVLSAYVAQLLRPIDKLNELNEAVSRGVVAGERLASLLAEQPLVSDRPDAVTVHRAAGRLELRDVWFSYPADGPARLPVLRGVNVTFEPNRLTVLLGTSGAGKSTVISLLVRLFDPTSGSIWLDGRPIETIALASLRAQFAVMTQDLHLFSGSLRETIGAVDIDESRVWDALRLVALDEFVRSLPAGLETRLGEDGVNLSGGQRQRLSLARALLLDRPILLLDEPLANVDTVSARVILGALRTLRASRTLVAITHESSLVDHADAVYHLAGGTARVGPPSRPTLEVVR